MIYIDTSVALAHLLSESRRILFLCALSGVFIPGNSAAAQPVREPVFDAAELPSGVLIGRIASAVQLSSGTYVVADDVERKLHLFDAKGRYQRSVGRQGKGPRKTSAAFVNTPLRHSAGTRALLSNPSSVIARNGMNNAPSTP